MFKAGVWRDRQTPYTGADVTIINESVVREIIPELKALGAEGIIEYPLNKVVYLSPARPPCP